MLENVQQIHRRKEAAESFITYCTRSSQSHERALLAKCHLLAARDCVISCQRTVGVDGEATLHPVAVVTSSKRRLRVESHLQAAAWRSRKMRPTRDVWQYWIYFYKLDIAWSWNREQRGIFWTLDGGRSTKITFILFRRGKFVAQYRRHLLQVVYTRRYFLGLWKWNQRRGGSAATWPRGK